MSAPHLMNWSREDFPDWERRVSHIDRTVVQLATAAAGLFFLLLGSIWIVDRDVTLLYQALAPLAVAGAGVVMLATGRPRAVVQIGVGALGLVLYTVASAPDVAGDPLLGLLTMGIAGAALVRSRIIVYTAIAAAVLAVAALWQAASLGARDRAVLAFSVLIAFLFTAWLLHWLKSQSMTDRAKLRELIASKDEFVATISHELRTPLTAVVGLAHELQGRLGDFTTDEIEEFAALLVAESSDIADIVEDLLVVARADVGNLSLDRQHVDIASVVKSATTDLVDDGDLARPDGSLIVNADPLRLRQIIRNLVVNAVRYGGERVRVVTASNGAIVSVEVRDNGPALPVQDREEIFQAYRRAATVAGTPGSMGLGLTVSRRLARLMDGDVVYDHDGAEAVFSLRLPLVPERTAVEAGAPAS